MTNIEWIKDKDEVLAIIVPDDYLPDKTEFVTPDDYKQQLGFVVYDKEGTIVPHVHVPMKRNLIGTSEVLFIKTGRIEVSLYNKEKQYITKRILEKGDMIVLVGGGARF